MYWFYILKGFEETEGTLESINISSDVFIADDRTAAKKHLATLFPNLPYRKPKNPSLDNKYIYLAESDKYWYDRQHREVEITCNKCMQKKMITGTKNIKYFKDLEYCSIECMELAKKEYLDDYISEEDHVGLSRYKDEIVGYIYKITNKHTLKSYVGQTIKPALFRWWQHLKIDKKFEQEDISQLVFEVLEVVTFSSKEDTLYTNSKDKLNKREAYYIKLYDTVNEGYNEVQPKEFEHNLFTLIAE